MIFSASRNVISTYRLQLGPELSFDGVRDLLPYLRDLGISHLYLSPCFKAAAGSTHGYDVVNPSEVNPRLGGLEAFERLSEASAELGMGLVLDIVPNHMAAAGRQNRWWWDVLEKGRRSRYAEYFDIRWDHPEPALNGKILLPVLGNETERCLESRQILIRRGEADIHIAYFEQEFPISDRSLFHLLREAAATSGNRSLLRLAESLAAAIPWHNDESARGRQPAVEDRVAPNAMDEEAAAALDETIAAVNADPFRLKGFLDLQHYRLAFWRRANRELNYRRFFDIHHLIGLCVEKDEVFSATHEMVLRWVREGRIDGLRIDHPDGLRDPTSYMARLRTQCPRTWIVAEKILEPGEGLAREWPVDGTTGYDFLNILGGLYVDPRGERFLTDFYESFTGRSGGYGEVVHEKKRLVLEALFGSEVSHLLDLLEESILTETGSEAFSRGDLGSALEEIIACFPVYRTYIRPDTGEVGPRDRAIIREALDAARQRQPRIDARVWQSIEDRLLLGRAGGTESEFLLRFQQLTGSVMAKGVEDTAFYCFNRLISLNEVGGNPGNFGTSPEGFHAFCLRLQSAWPRTMTTNATHDTKRGEDARLRISLLSEIPERWIDAVRRWSGMNAPFKRSGFPDADTEYFFYQTLAGAWPIGKDRLASVMLKAAREAKVYTSWTDRDLSFEAALGTFVERAAQHTDFVADLTAFLESIAWPAIVTSLSQTLVKCTVPGVPDIYQGSELWDLNLMDPDNRRPVDFIRRHRLLAEIGKLSLGDILSRHAEGLPKLFVLQRALSVRRQFAEAFGPAGDYRPLAADGEQSGRLVAFVRGGRVATLAPRLVVGLKGCWGDTVIELPEGIWKNEFTGEHISGGPQRLSRIFEPFPVALLVRKGRSDD